MSSAAGRPSPDALDRLTALLDPPPRVDPDAVLAGATAGGVNARAGRPVVLDAAVLRIVAGLVVLAFAAAGVAGFLFFRGRPAPVPAGRPTLSVSGGPSASGSASASSGVVVVAVAGAVRRPGVVRLPAGSRVVDAIAAAGGAKPGTDLGTVNLAAKVTDGEQVLVGAAAVAAAGGAAGWAAGAAAGGVLNLNSATAGQLDALPGVGPVTAERIVAWRTTHGGFQRVEQLQDVPGIGPSKFAQLRDLVSL